MTLPPTDADAHRADYAASLRGASLKGVRLGLILPPPDHSPSPTDIVLQHAVDLLQAQGAVIVEIHDFTPPAKASDEEGTVLQYELKHDMAQYLQSLPSAGPKTLADLIAFDAVTPRELVLFDQDYFNMAEAKGDLGDSAYVQAHQDLRASTRALLDATLAANHLDALIRATDDPAFRTDVVKGDNENNSDSFLPATAGTPHLTVPMGQVAGLPVGISFMGAAWSEAKLLAIGAAFEQRRPGAQAADLYCRHWNPRPRLPARWRRYSVKSARRVSRLAWWVRYRSAACRNRSPVSWSATKQDR